jgi:hypothetical protein
MCKKYNALCGLVSKKYLLLPVLLLTVGLLPGQQRLTSQARQPIALRPELSVSFFGNMSYGSDQLQTFDLFVPNSSKQLPLVIFIHGGGFEGGDKSDLYGQDWGVNLINALLSEGIAFASVNYRLLAVGDTTGVLKSMVMPATACNTFGSMRLTSISIKSGWLCTGVLRAQVPRSGLACRRI